MKTSGLRQTVRIVMIGFVVASVGQETKVTPPPAPQTLAQALRSHGLRDLSEEALVAALSGNDAQVRLLAANKLAEDHRHDAAPAIESALEREQNTDTRVGLAEALWVLRDEKGASHLQLMCSDSSLSFQAIMSAVRALKLTRSPCGICVETFLSAMSHEKEPSMVAMGASLLPSIYRDSSPNQGKRIVSALLSLLLDQKQQSIVRMTSSQALTEIAAPESATAIREAISQEQDPSTRLFFETNLKTLEKNP